jgi:hypothetical protein
MSKIGLDCKLYRSTTLLTASDAAAASGATWVEVKSARDVELQLDGGEGDISKREFKFDLTKVTNLTASIEVTMPLDIADAHYIAFETAAINGSPIAIAAMSGDIATTGERGLVGNFSVFSLPRSEPRDGAVEISFTLRPTSHPQWFVKAA